MTPAANPLEKRLQTAGILLIIGLLVEGLCLFSARPIAFVIFVSVGGLFLFAGIVTYLFALVSTPRKSTYLSRESRRDHA